jgi:hypothetical protein
VLARAIGDGVKRGDVATDALQAVTRKNGDGLGMALDDPLHNTIGGDSFWCVRDVHGTLHLEKPAFILPYRIDSCHDLGHMVPLDGREVYQLACLLQPARIWG